MGPVDVIGVGYEGMSADRFVDELLAARVDAVADVRLNPVSRKAGFSKRSLTEMLERVGVRYLHYPTLGNPRWNRPGFAEQFSPSATAAREVYRDLLRGHAAQSALNEIIRLCADGTVALLCFEFDGRYCHREIIIEQLADARLAQV